MSLKRPSSPTLVANPFIKKRNLDWTIRDDPQSDSQETANQVPPENVCFSPSPSPLAAEGEPEDPSAAEVEAGTAEIEDHLTYFSHKLSSSILIGPHVPLLPDPDYASLYKRNHGSSRGSHFVIHQHDHPVAGVHYDLRLQINATSSASWAIMYGLPGDPNSVRLNRNATETRVHCLWNHLVESASAATGSLLIWDTGTYTILPRKSKHAPASDPSSPVSAPSSPEPFQPDLAPSHSRPLAHTTVKSSPTSHADKSQQQLLYEAFQNRKIRIQLHGSKLPERYVLNLRITKLEDALGRAKIGRKPKFRRRKGVLTKPIETSSESDADNGPVISSPAAPAGHITDNQAEGKNAEQVPSAMERELQELEDEQVRATNSYPGAENTIGSIHQRKWYVSLDRTASGFVKRHRYGKTRWEPADSQYPTVATDDEQGAGTRSRLKYPFYVRGVEKEWSVVTGRVGADVLHDEGVVNFIGRKGWKAVLS